MTAQELRCAATTTATAPCPDLAAPGAPVPLCTAHLALTAEWVGREFGAPDALPSACPACGARLGLRFPTGWLCAVCEWRYGDLPDGELPPPRVDVVYYIRFGDRIKIGTTANPRQRMARLWHEQLLAFEPGDRRVEAARHEQFAALRYDRTEWFATGPELERHVAEVGAGHPDPWALHARWVSEALARRV
ncbi:T5orf172 domain-containing protein [Frondihabitans sp. PhB188]|uniref:GIY-YIG nuclease family protein n=1 Tax=Frondihabitans sp. PhB188 TaxID=2485200 RepID=UPI000F4796A4|nr:GIY-YIG nuclease family protein [Frondihabitans sp. PhB188]ROQ37147.1 T5orf172 domain-containing protein [Frondihabitans sp. PhB188]